VLSNQSTAPDRLAPAIPEDPCHPVAFASDTPPGQIEAGTELSLSDSAGLASTELVCIGTSTTLSVDSQASRIRLMRRGVFTTARVLEETFQREGNLYRKAFITLTYREGVAWSPRHVTDTLQCYDAWARRRAIRLVYVRVAELQQRGAIHYHIFIWLPRGLTPPMPDKQGWWKHGSSNAK